MSTLLTPTSPFSQRRLGNITLFFLRIVLYFSTKVMQINGFPEIHTGTFQWSDPQLKGRTIMYNTIITLINHLR